MKTMTTFQSKPGLDSARIIRLITSALLGIAGVLAVMAALAEQEGIDYWHGYIDSAPLQSAAWFGIAMTMIWPIICLVFSAVGFFVNKLRRFWGIGSSLATAIILVLNWALAGYVMTSSPVQGAKFSFGIGFGVWYGQFGIEPILEEIASQGLLLLSLIGSIFFISMSGKAEYKYSGAVEADSNPTTPRPIETDGGRVSFLRSLFDFGFDHFIYVKVASVTYFLIVLVLAIADLFIFIGTVLAVVQDQLPSFYLLLGPACLIASLFVVILTRLTLEGGVALIKIAENTRKK